MTAQLSKILRSFKDGNHDAIAFFCPGCREMHSVWITGSGAWGYNGNPEAPTVTPSILVRGGHFAEGFHGGDCWCNFETRTGRAPSFKCRQCHSFVTDGKIQFRQDCSHDLAGQTVALPAFGEGEEDQ